MTTPTGQIAQPPVISIETPISPTTKAFVPLQLLEERGGVQPPQTVIKATPMVIGVSPPSSANPAAEYYSTINDFAYVAGPTDGSAPNLGLQHDTLTVLTADTIPALSRPFNASGFGLVVVGGVATPAVTFTGGSTAVAFNAALAGFHLTPGETVEAYYSY